MLPFPRLTRGSEDGKEYAFYVSVSLQLSTLPLSRGKGAPVKMLMTCRQLATIAAGLACVVLLAAPAAIAQETGDSQIFLAGLDRKSVV